MMRLIKLSPVLFLFCVAPAFSQKKVKPDINESREFPGVFHSPSADATPKEFRSVFQMEVVVKKGDSDAEAKYTNGTVVSTDGLIVTVLDQPGVNGHEAGGIESASVLMLDGTGANATLVAFEPAYGVAVFRVKGVDMRPLVLSEASPVANRRVNWHAVFNNGGKTYLYTRPLRVYQAAHPMAEREDLCQVIDLGTSSLNADRSGSALVSLDELSEVVRESGLEQAVLTAEPYVPRERVTEVEDVIRKAGVEDIELAAPKAD